MDLTISNLLQMFLDGNRQTKEREYGIGKYWNENAKRKAVDREFRDFIYTTDRWVASALQLVGFVMK
jgi:hypothetical protein